MQKSVLIAESNRFFLTTLSEAFPLLGFTVVGTTSKLSALNVLAQTLMQAPIHVRIGNFHVTAEYANALTAWFFGLFAVVFGMKIPNI